MFLEIHKTMCPLGYHHNGFIFLEIQNVNNAIVNKLNEAYNAGKLFIVLRPNFKRALFKIFVAPLCK